MLVPSPSAEILMGGSGPEWTFVTSPLCDLILAILPCCTLLLWNSDLEVLPDPLWD